MKYAFQFLIFIMLNTGLGFLVAASVEAYGEIVIWCISPLLTVGCIVVAMFAVVLFEDLFV